MKRQTDRVESLHKCPTCGHAVFRDRKTAKAAVRQSYPGSGLRPYPACEGTGFHLGTLAPIVMDGTHARDDVYGDRP